MKVLVTGAKGFVGRNLISQFRYQDNIELYEYDLDTPQEMLDIYCRSSEFVYHLAGVNRPEELSDYMEGNWGFTFRLLNTLKKFNNSCPIMMASSIQAVKDNLYGKSKLAGELLLQKYSSQTGSQIYVYRFPNLYGKWSMPNYNSVVATFCYNIARNLPITVHDSNTDLDLVYIDDVIYELASLLEHRGHVDTDGYYYVPNVTSVTVGRLAELIKSFSNYQTNLGLPQLNDVFQRNLYATYLSYLPYEKMAYPLKMNSTEKGSFTELLRTADKGQVSVNILKPGITKGNHWHHTKVEKFIVVSGSGVVKQRRVDDDEVYEFAVTAQNLEVIEILPGFTHTIANTGDSDMVTVMWCSECYNSEYPDTYYMEL